MKFYTNCYGDELTMWCDLWEKGHITGQQYRSMRGQYHAGDYQALYGFFNNNFKEVGKGYFCDSCDSYHSTYEYIGKGGK
jgi:hypothetical protein